MTDPLDLMREHRAYYECPRDADGRRLGPLVGYAGRDEAGRQFVGDVYVNFAQAERHPALLARFSAALHETVEARGLKPVWDGVTGFCGAPEGGRAFAYQLALDAGREYIYPEKVVTEAATAGSREVTALALVRHQPEPGQAWFIVEDVCNNFSTTAKLVAELERFGATVAGVLCFLNRSLTVGDHFDVRPGLSIPVVAVVRKPFGQFRQDDPAVAADIAAGNVVWSPKRDWPRLAVR